MYISSEVRRFLTVCFHTYFGLWEVFAYVPYPSPPIPRKLLPLFQEVQERDIDLAHLIKEGGDYALHEL